MIVNKRVTINEREYVLRELTIREIIDLFENTSTGANEVSDTETADASTFMKGQIQRLLSLALEGNYKLEDFYDMRPSDVKEIYDAFKEANKVFFDIAAEMGMNKVLQEMKSLMQREFSAVLVSSSKAAIQKSSTTVTPTS